MQLSSPQVCGRVDRSHHVGSEDSALIWTPLSIAIGMMACEICVLCHKPTAAGLRSILHPKSQNNTEQRRFFVNFVSPGYQWPVGQGGPTLYVCRRTCQIKLQQGVIKAADLKKIVNELRIQHTPNQSTLSQGEIYVIIPGEEPPCETLVSGMDDLDRANLQTHQSLLGKRKVPCELPCTPEINKMPKIVTDPQVGMSRRRLLYVTPPASTTG